MSGYKALMQEAIKFIFVHSYHGNRDNWKEVLFGMNQLNGRWSLARDLSEKNSAQILYSIGRDPRSEQLFRAHGTSLGQAENTREEARDLACGIRGAGVLVISSPDHLPRCVLEHEKHNRSNTLFYMASRTQYSTGGLSRLTVVEHND